MMPPQVLASGPKPCGGNKRDYSHSREYFDISSNPCFKCFLYFPLNSVCMFEGYPDH